MWFGFVLSATVIAWFGVRMTQAVRERDAQLGRLRENRLRHEQVVALGALAAGAAHELGTPLGTLNILADELEPGVPLEVATCEVLRTQIKRCKDILNSIAASSGTVRAQGGGQMALDEFLHSIVSSWLATRPECVLVKSSCTGSEPVPRIVTEHTITQAIHNLLNNAADASLDNVEINCRWTPEELNIEVADRGPGLAPEIAQRAGEAFATTKTDGLGLGLFLTFTTLERMGGEIHLYNREGGGTRCRLTLPLSSLSVTP
jgi:two-component system sensor histidine kinase RegB